MQALAAPSESSAVQLIVMEVRGCTQALTVLRELSAAVKAGGGRHLVGGALTYADIAMAVPLKLLLPAGPAYNRSRPSSLAGLPAEMRLQGRTTPCVRMLQRQSGRESV